MLNEVIGTDVEEADDAKGDCVVGTGMTVVSEIAVDGVAINVLAVGGAEDERGLDGLLFCDVVTSVAVNENEVDGLFVCDVVTTAAVFVGVFVNAFCEVRVEVLSGSVVG